MRLHRASRSLLLSSFVAALALLAVSACAQPAAPPASQPATTAAAPSVATTSAAAPAPAAAAPATPGASAPAPSAVTSQSAVPAPAGPTAAAAAARKPQGTLVVGVPTLGKGAFGLPSRQDSDASYAAANVMEPLLRIDDNGTLLPNLAEKWQVSPDGLKITFNLRKGVQFHEGWGELTADDVKFSYTDVLADGSVAPGKTGFIRLVKSVDIVDKYSVVFNVGRGDALTVLNAGVNTTPFAFLPITSKKYVESVGLDKAASAAIGTGPWKFVKFLSGDSVTFEAVEGHWRQTPFFKTLTLREVPEMSSLVAMLRAGDIDIAAVTADYRKELVAAGLKVVEGKPGLAAFFQLGGMIEPTHKNFDPKIPWVGDPKDATSAGNALKVRKALNLAVNRPQLMETILGGGPPSAVAWFDPGAPFYDPAWKIPYDPAQAKQLLRDAGYPAGFAFELYVVKMGGRPWLPDLTEAVAMQWEQNLGVKIKRTPTERAVIVPHLRDRSFGQSIAGQGQPNFVEPHLGPHASARSTGAQSMAAESKQLDAMLDQIVNEIDDKKRAALIRAFGQYRLDNYLDVPIGDSPRLWAASKKVGEYRNVYGSTSLREFEYATPAR